MDDMIDAQFRKFQESYSAQPSRHPTTKHPFHAHLPQYSSNQFSPHLVAPSHLTDEPADGPSSEKL